eukprot:4966671-Pyramimonas_sp.AAC.1
MWRGREGAQPERCKAGGGHGYTSARARRNTAGHAMVPWRASRQDGSRMGVQIVYRFCVCAGAVVSTGSKTASLGAPLCPDQERGWCCVMHTADRVVRTCNEALVERCDACGTDVV